MSRSPDFLYELLPVVYRERDVEQGQPLRALLRVIGEQVEVVEEDIAQLYENWFIETCQDWVVPYAAGLIGYQPVHEAGEPGEVSTPQGQQRNKILVPRREVANTIRYRRRKGTLALLELLARDVAGWPARAVEFYRVLSLTQAINHLHLERGRTVDLRQVDLLDRLDGPFDELAHAVDVRRITSHRTPGRHNIPTVGLYVWRLKDYRVTETPAYSREEFSTHCYTFSVLGNDTPLYTRSEPEPDPSDIAGEMNLPAPIRRRAFEARKADYYGAGKSLEILVGDSREPVPPEQIIPADLTDWRYRPRRHEEVAVDPELGRLAFHPRRVPSRVWVTYTYGFSADIGGGEYDRPLSPPTEHLLFDEDDLKDPAGLIRKLLNPLGDISELSLYIWNRFPEETRQLLEEYGDADPLPKKPLKALIDGLNLVLVDEDLYDKGRFNEVHLREEIREFARWQPQGRSLMRFNRLLLERAYKDEIAKGFVLYLVGRGRHASKHINQALERWRDERPRHAAIEITDSSVYEEQINISLRKNQSLQLRAANGKRPVIRLLDWHTDLPDALSVSGRRGSRFILDGLLISGRGVQVGGKLTSMTIRHSTLVPGWELRPDCEPAAPSEPSLQLFNTPNLCVDIQHSIVGSIQVNQDEVRTDPIRILVTDSVLDATSPEREALGAPGWPVAHARVTIARSTVLGQVQAHAIDLAENSIFIGCIKVARRQWGCMRHCYVTPDSRTPRRYNCQPDLVEQAVEQQVEKEWKGATVTKAERESRQRRERERVRPQFNSVRYGMPAYCQLSEVCADEIKRGADDESEMGVFHDLFQPQREANLRARLDEYTPAGTDAGIIFAS
jgi:hypothetical protein